VIVRILGEGQYDLEGEALHELKVADARLFEAVAAADEAAYRARFQEVLSLVRGKGRRVPIDRLVESDLILPPAETTLQEARQLFGDEGPGDGGKAGA